MLNLTIRDKRALVTEAELSGAIQAGVPVLLQAQKGEERFAESQGWLDVEEWANAAVLENIKTIAERVRSSCDAFVLIGVGGSLIAIRKFLQV